MKEQKEQHVTYPVAVLAMELGFDWEDKLSINTNGVINHVSIGVTCPTQSLLQKWLRKKHKLHTAVYPILQHWQCDVRSCNPLNKVHVSYSNELDGKEFKEYEDALEAALLYALKLIKKQCTETNQ